MKIITSFTCNNLKLCTPLGMSTLATIRFNATENLFTHTIKYDEWTCISGNVIKKLQK